MRVISLIPARGGSKTIFKKNIKKLLGRSLINYTLKDASNTDLIDEVFVSTEDEDISKIAQNNGASIIKRPQEYATDESSTESVMIHAAKTLEWNFDYMVLLQPTSPLRTSEIINSAIKKILEENGDSLLSVYKNSKFIWNKNSKPLNYDFQNRPRRQDKDWEYVENGSIYITSKKILKEEKNRLGGKILLYLMPEEYSFEIDSHYDWNFAEFIMKKHVTLDSSKLKKIKLIIFDIDGVFTDGSVYLDDEGKEILRFSRIDGKGLELLRKEGIDVAVISSEDSKSVQSRMKKLNFPDNSIFLGVKNKIKIYEDLKIKKPITDEEIAFLGDDVQDIEIMKNCGFSASPINAQEKVKIISDYISPLKGGEGFIRDVINKLLEREND